MEKSSVVTGTIRSKTGAVAMSVARAEAHDRMRKAWAYPFSTTALLQQEALVTGHIDKMINQLRLLASQNPKGVDQSHCLGQAVVDLSSWFKYLTFDILGELTFAEPFGCLDQGADTKWSTSVSQLGRAVMMEQPTRRLVGEGRLQKALLRLLVPKDAMKWRLTHFENSTRKTLHRIADEDRSHKDFLFYILKNSDAKRALTVDEIVVNSSLMMYVSLCVLLLTPSRY